MAVVLSAPAAGIDVPLPPAGEPTLRAAARPEPPPAPKRPPARFVFTFDGRGYGHGVGMSQYGAYGAALAGRSATQIIAMYYRGSTIGMLPPTPVRVLLGTSAGTVTLTSATPWKVSVEGATPPVDVPLAPGPVTVTRTGATTVVSGPDGVQLATAPGAVRLAAVAEPSVIGYRGSRYRGVLRVIPDGGALTVVNHLELEQYLPGVVPREMPASWGNRAPAALQAQAIAARTYAMATKRSGGLFDMYADERSQVYGGVTGEDPRTSQAVAATAGQVVMSGGQLLTTFFFSTSGGMTENVENVFRGSPRASLVAVRDAAFDRLSPHHVWKDAKSFTDVRLARLVGLRNPILHVRVIQRGASPRAKMVRFVARNGTVRDLRGTEVRRLLGLRDTWMTPRRRVLTPQTLRLVTERRTATRP